MTVLFLPKYAIYHCLVLLKNFAQNPFTIRLVMSASTSSHPGVLLFHEVRYLALLHLEQ